MRIPIKGVRLLPEKPTMDRSIYLKTASRWNITRDIALQVFARDQVGVYYRPAFDVTPGQRIGLRIGSSSSTTFRWPDQIT